jgi:hypothetical protein
VCPAQFFAPRNFYDVNSPDKDYGASFVEVAHALGATDRLDHVVRAVEEAGAGAGGGAGARDLSRDAAAAEAALALFSAARSRGGRSAVGWESSKGEYKAGKCCNACTGDGNFRHAANMDDRVRPIPESGGCGNEKYGFSEASGSSACNGVSKMNKPRNSANRRSYAKQGGGGPMGF